MGLAVIRFTSKKLAWILALVIILATILFAVDRYGAQAFLYFKVRRALPYADSYGTLSATPRPITESAVSSGKSTVLSYFGCRFELPWREVVLERNEGRWAEAQFKTGQTVRILNPAELYAHDDLIASRVAGSSSIWEMALRQGFPKSKYEQFKAVVSATPAQLSPFQTRPQFARTLVLINQKGAYFEHNPFKPDIFSFEKLGFRGFEMSIELPLLPAVAKALIAYLQRERPPAKSTQPHFLRKNMPYEPMTSSAIRFRIRHYARLAGISAKVIGAHAFRDSHASRQVDAGANIKVVKRHPSSPQFLFNIGLCSCSFATSSNCCTSGAAMSGIFHTLLASELRGLVVS